MPFDVTGRRARRALLAFVLLAVASACASGEMAVPVEPAAVAERARELQDTVWQVEEIEVIRSPILLFLLLSYLRIFTTGVPKYRCSGLQHTLVLQVCRT